MMNADIVLEKFDGTEEEAEKAIEQGEFDSYLVLEENEAEEPLGVYKAETVAEQVTPQVLEAALQQMKSTFA
ncbi:ABC transporter permease, partial [Staphylococcus sp. SIMBA_130]